MPHVLLLILLWTSCSSAQPSAPKSNEGTDRDCLLAIKGSYRSGVLASWNATDDFCQWPGVICSHRHKQRVLELNLSSAGLVGTINPSFNNLTFLASLDLSSNALHGGIPSSLGRLRWLRYLNLYNNSLQGDITAELQNCTSLASINLAFNQLSGVLPVWLGGLSKLTSVYMGHNNFTGIIPPSLANLSSLQELYLDTNNLNGPIPKGLGRLGSLAFLALQGNHLSGTIPGTLFNLSSLSRFSVTMNELHGMLSSGVGDNLPKLQYLLLGENHFTGSIPASLANATMIYNLDLSANNFTGSLPPVIGNLCPNIFTVAKNQLEASSEQHWEFMKFSTNCSRLRAIDIGYNHFASDLPSFMSNLSTELQMLHLGHNEISGKIPIDTGNLIGLLQLWLSNNKFTGNLPDSIGRMKMLLDLRFENNLLSGILPSSLGNLTQLGLIYAHNNSFHGPLPSSLGNLQQLTEATFSNNELSGPLPKEIFNLSSLSYALVLSSNNFVGSLPSEVGGLTKLVFLYISGNNLSGSLPDELGNCQSMMELCLDGNSFNNSIPASISKIQGLVLLNLTNNMLYGAIPQQLGLMTGLENLYLAHNNLSGEIPATLENMGSLYQLDISFNHLTGQVPVHGVFANTTGFLFVGNNRLCGGIQELLLPACPERMDDGPKHHQVIRKFVIPIASTIILCLILVSIIFFFRRKPKTLPSRTTGHHLVGDKNPRVSYADLVKATDGFSSSNLIGAGRYGSVYKGTLWLRNTRTEVAVKVFDLQQSGSSKSFSAECETLSKLRHRNLISVITCCSGFDSDQNGFKALVFDFMPNNNLDTWLHPDSYKVPSVPPLQGLTLMQRLSIASDVVDALDYLHNDCQPPVVHCDLKPSNILLDEDLSAHVGDFVLAKILSDPSGHMLINSKSTIGIRGTVGYLAPEYGEGSEVSPSGDVYSFGIILLEMLTGKVPTHSIFTDGLTLQKHVEMAFPDQLMDIVDPAILSIEDSDLQDKIQGWGEINGIILSIIKLAMMCCKQTPAERICTRDAAVEMHRIRMQYVT
ncbi:hypothetical protein SEVIR_2G435700v4 [Setaria viridis]|nr:hypothetical protein SEVIR_2G435700v2 [Setaria viridis]